MTPPRPGSVPLALRMSLRQGGFSLDVAWEGRCRLLGLFGPSGSGKTTVLEVMAGLRRPNKRAYRVGDAVLRDTVGGHRRADPRARDRLRAAGVGAVSASRRPRQHHLRRGARQRRAAPANPGDAVDRAADRSGGGRPVGRRAPARGACARDGVVAEAAAARRAAVGRRRAAPPSHPASRSATGSPWRGVPTLHVSHDAGDLQVATDHVLILREGRLAGEGSAATL